ncbi:MAG: protein kinase, partial [Lentisphaeria bacterium]|nr:protein kinase [Lentisphaeria bacterium]
KESYSIVCADDDPEIQRIFQKMLERRGYTVRVCSDGAQVLREIKEEPADLIIMDYQMPVMDGRKACQILRKRPESFNIPIIFVSGYKTEEDVFECLDMGGTYYLSKPFQASELLAKVRHALKKYSEHIETGYDVEPGTRIAERYEIMSKIDSGGSSSVYKVFDVIQRENNIFACKLFEFPFSRRSDKEFLSHILREAYTLSKLDHDGIVKMHDFGQYGSYIYLIMEFVDGTALDYLVKENKTLKEANCAFVGFEIAEVLEYLSKKDMVHRDIKPDNIMITHDGDVKLVDFGLAKQLNEATISVNRDEFKGTAQFVAPEYIDGAEATIQSDVYSLGTTLYYVSTGVMPFDGANLTEILQKHLTHTPKPVNEINTELSQVYADLVNKMLSKSPEDRPTPAELIVLIGEIMSHTHETIEMIPQQDENEEINPNLIEPDDNDAADDEKKDGKKPKKKDDKSKDE